MALVEFKRDPTPREVRQFSLVWLPAFCLLAAGVAIYRFDSVRAAVVFAACGVLSVVLCLLRPRWMRGVFLGWMWAAWPIGWIVSHTLMAAIYFLVITPIGLVLRAVGRDPLERKFDREAESYWTPRATDVDPSSYFKQF